MYNCFGATSFLGMPLNYDLSRSLSIVMFTASMSSLGVCKCTSVIIDIWKNGIT